MSEYELVEKLKKAGYSLEPFSLEKHGSGNGVSIEGSPSVKIPSLSELIKECGEKFDKLEKIYDHWRAYMTEEAFDDMAIPCVYDCDGYECGDTPEEAVANLFVALNQK